MIVELEFVRTLQANVMDAFEKLQQTRRALVCIRHHSKPLSAHVAEGDKLFLDQRFESIYRSVGMTTRALKSVSEANFEAINGEAGSGSAQLSAGELWEV